MRSIRAFVAIALCAGVHALAPTTATAGVAVPASTERVSVSSTGAEAAAYTANRALSMSADGRYVAFVSSAPNLVPGDTNDRLDVFVRDRLAHTTERVSVSSSGAQADGDSAAWGASLANNAPSISADGRYVTFESAATNLGNDLNGGVEDIFVHDRTTRQTVLIAYYGRQPQISADGRFVTWTWEGTVSRRERTGAGHTTIGQGAQYSVISGDGRYVGFVTQNGFVPDDNNGGYDVYVRDTQTGSLERVSLTSSAQERFGHSQKPSFSFDGRYVAFQSNAPLVPQDTSCCSTDIFVRDRLSGTTERVNVSSGGAEANGESGYPWISNDGRFVAFESWASNLVTGDTGNSQDVFLRDRLSATTEMMSVAMAGGPGGGYAPTVSSDGRFVAFSSLGGGLVPGDTNAWEDVFVRDRGRRHQCDDGLDNDSDGRIDLGADVGCGADDDDDESDEPSLSVADVSVAEDAGLATFAVELTAPSDYEVAIDWTTSGITAQSPDDFSAAGGTLTIPAGATSAQVDVIVAADVVDELDETFVLTLSDARNALIADGRAVATIIDDDEALLSIGDAVAAEGDSGAAPVAFVVSLSTPSSQTVSVDVATADGSAFSPADYASGGATLTFTPGMVSQSFAVNVEGDTIDEPDETFSAVLSNSLGAAIAKGVAAGTIRDDDRNGVFTCRASALRGAGGEPSVANDGPVCADDEVTATGFALNASTSQAPDDQAGTDPAAGDGGEANAELVRITIGAVTVRGATALVRADCGAGPAGLQVSLSGSSSVTAIRLGDGPEIPVGVMSFDLPLPGGATLHLNHESIESGEILRRAAWIESPAGDVVIAETRAGADGDPCSG